LGGEDKGCKNYKYVKASCDWSTGLQSVKVGTSSSTIMCVNLKNNSLELGK